MSSPARSRANPLNQKQPVSPLAAVEEALRQGLAPVLSVCEVRLETDESVRSGYQLFRVLAFGQEWHFDAAISAPAAYSTGQSVARMVVEAGKKHRATQTAATEKEPNGTI